VRERDRECEREAERQRERERERDFCESAQLKSKCIDRERMKAKMPQVGLLREYKLKEK
jgi:hypothetical protein